MIEFPDNLPIWTGNENGLILLQEEESPYDGLIFYAFNGAVRTTVRRGHSTSKPFWDNSFFWHALGGTYEEISRHIVEYTGIGNESTLVNTLEELPTEQDIIARAVAGI